MNDRVVVRVEGLSKRFKIYDNPWNRAFEWLTLGRRCLHSDFWAVREVSFELRAGEVLGVIGPNGAGKTTLLRLLTGSLQATSGHCEIRGPALSLLEIGTGFDRELTGRQNVLYSAEVRGIPEEQVAGRLPEIEEFAELGEFFDHPLKLYSSGMQARLGFAVVSTLACDVLIVDEVLAVGDIFFRQKCHLRIRELIAQEKAVILVTHSMATVREFCDRTMVMDHGRAIYLGDPNQAINHHLGLEQKRSVSVSRLEEHHRESSGAPVADTDFSTGDGRGISGFWPPEEAFLDLSALTVKQRALIRCVRVAVCDESGNPCRLFESGEWVTIWVEFSIGEPIGIPVARAALFSDRALLISGRSSLHLMWPRSLPQVPAGRRLRFRQDLKLDVEPGDYSLEVALHSIPPDVYLEGESIASAELESAATHLVNIERGIDIAVTTRSKGLRLAHIGVCSLPSRCAISIDSLDRQEG